MSDFGLNFYELLKRINYPLIKQFEPHDFVWLEYQSGQSFLWWIMENLSMDYYLSEDEISSYRSLGNDVCENADERRYMLNTLSSLQNGKLSSLTNEYYSQLVERNNDLSSELNALKSQVQSKSQRYRILLKKHAKLRQILPESRQQLEKLLTTLSCTQDLSYCAVNIDLGLRFIQAEENFLIKLNTVWNDDEHVILPELVRPTPELIQQLNESTWRLVQMETKLHLTEAKRIALIAQIDLTKKLKPFFTPNNPLNSLKILADRTEKKAPSSDQIRQCETSLRELLERSYRRRIAHVFLGQLKREYAYLKSIYDRSSKITTELLEHRSLYHLFDHLLSKRLTVPDEMITQMRLTDDYLQLIKTNMIVTNSQIPNKNDDNKSLTVEFKDDNSNTNVIDQIKLVQKHFDTNHATCLKLTDYIGTQSSYFLPMNAQLTLTKLNEDLNERNIQLKQIKQQDKA